MSTKSLGFGTFSALCLALTTAYGIGMAGQARGPQNPPLVISSMHGRDLFEFYCASCHGRDGRGSGPAASALKTPPADLTRIATRHGNTFPTPLIESLVAAGDPSSTPAHGSREMPVWGPIFRALDPTDKLTTVRISNIVGYLKSIQVK